MKKVIKRVIEFVLKYVKPLFYIISIFSLVYFTIKYYHDQVLTFDNQSIFKWSAIVLVILISLGLGIFNAIEIRKVRKQNTELLSLVKELCERQESTCEEVLLTLQNSREISLDIFNEMREK